MITNQSIRLLQLWKPSSTLIFAFARERRKSEWVYSNKADEMSQIHKGRIFICSHFGNDAYNYTLRMLKAFELSHIVLAYNPIQIGKMLKTIAKKDRFTDTLSTEQTSALVEINTFSDLMKSNKNEEKEKGYQVQIQMSNHIEMNLQIQKINKSNNDRQNRLLKQQQEQLIKFMEISSIKEQLVKYKSINGHPKVIQLTENLSRILLLRNGGIDIVCVISEDKIGSSKRLFQFLEQNKLPYEVLPYSNKLINMLAASGLPADRFAIEYFPNNLQSVLQKRRQMKMTIAIAIKKEQMITLINEIIKSYGGLHFIYMENGNGQKLFRGIAQEAMGQIDNDKLTGQLIHVAVSPYLSAFNQDLKEEKNKVSRLYGQAMDDKTHFVRMEFINKELEVLLKRKDSRMTPIDPMIQELLTRMKVEQVESIVKDILKLGIKETKLLVERAKKGMIQDHIGIDQLSKRR